MPWFESSPMQQRIDFLARVHEGKHSFTELCTAFKISRKTGYKWVARFRGGGHPALADASRARKFQSTSTPEPVVRLLLALKEEFPRFGPKKLVVVLGNRHPTLAVPAASTAGEILKRHGLVCPARRRRESIFPARSELRPVGGPNSTWCADFKGHFQIRTGQWVYPATLMDGHSRKLLRCAALTGTRRRSTLDVWTSAFREYGLPSVIRTDNGVPFAATHGKLNLSHIAVRLIELGISPEFTKRASPYENGALERMHRTLKAATVKPAATSFKDQQQRFNDFCALYNSVRPHESLGMRTPDEVYVPSPRRYPDEVPVPDYPEHFEVKRANSNGAVSWRGTQYPLALALTYKLIGIERVCPGLVRFVFFDKVLAMLDELGNEFILNMAWHHASTEL